MMELMLDIWPTSTLYGLFVITFKNHTNLKYPFKKHLSEARP